MRQTELNRVETHGAGARKSVKPVVGMNAEVVDAPAEENERLLIIPEGIIRDGEVVGLRDRVSNDDENPNLYNTGIRHVDVAHLGAPNECHKHNRKGRQRHDKICGFGSILLNNQIIFER